MTTPAPTDLRALDIGRFRPQARKLLAGAAALGLALTGLAQAPAEAAPKAKVDIALPTQRSVTVGNMYKLSDGGVALFTYDTDGWWTSTDGKKWSQPTLPSWTRGEGGFDLAKVMQGSDGKDYFVSADGWDKPRAARARVNGSSATTLSLPSNMSQIEVLPSGAIYATNDEAPTFYSFDKKAKTRISGLQKVYGIHSASACHVVLSGKNPGAPVEDDDWGDGMVEASVVYDTCNNKTLALTDLPSYDNTWVVSSGRLYGLGYDDKGSRSKLCSTSLTSGSSWSCTRLSRGVDEEARFTLSPWGVVAEANWSPKTGYKYSILSLTDGKAAWSFAGDCQATVTTGTVCVNKAKEIFLPSTKSVGKKVASLPKVTAAAIPVGFSGDNVLAAGRGDATELYSTTVARNGKSASKPKQLSAKRASSVISSAARTWVDGTLYDRGKAVSGAKKLPTVYDASGPYVLARSKSATTAYRTDGKKLKKLWSATKVDDKAGDLATAIFGSRILVTSVSKGNRPTKHRIIDAETGKTIATLKSKDAAFGFWGDEVYLFETGGWVKKWNTLSNKVTKVLKIDDNSFYGGGVSDGVAYVSGRLVNTAKGSSTKLSPSRATAVVVYNNKVAYSVDTKTGPKVRVETLTFGGKSAPRLLGTVAATSFTKGKTWKADFDLTKPLKKGTLVITDKKGKKIRSITLPATSDGSYRNVKWNGKDSKGKYVKPGTYTWTIKATDDPTRTGLKKGQAAKAIDGKKAASGTVKFKK